MRSIEKLQRFIASAFSARKVEFLDEIPLHGLACSKVENVSSDLAWNEINRASR